MKHPRQTVPVATCPTCGKKCYLSRKVARLAARQAHPGERVSAYECGPYWHLGHTPLGVIHGVYARSDLRRDA